MAFTRKALKALGLTEEQVEAVIESHLEVVEPLKAYKTDAEKLPVVQKELDDLKAKGDGGYKDKYEKEHKAFEDYKSEQTVKEARVAKETAVKAYLESKNITGNNLKLAMRGLTAEVDAVEIADGKIKDTNALDALISGDFAGLVSTSQTKGAKTSTPPSGTGNGKLTRAEIYAN